ncbi:PREDICTED: zinc finger protein CONSTANS-LIKE 13-like isoform X1 [Lupinus angustifolius]|uniref:zinc finger protein CONSTANS-LIKE 13-like isoform X1 n=1 Tax=Lupinus angustifolius TaxID=3871 RepID=UPI00092EF67A|nr:PREDICTED: zinc finger protein CONSTANS-LIKE 13-like isoform X1 [Lupinus angustifolius]
MYAETGLFFPYLQNFSPELHQLEEYCKTQKSNVSMSDLVQSSAMSEYDFAAEGDLFKAPEPIIEDPFLDLDHMRASISVMSREDDLSSQGLQSTDIDVLQKEQLLSDMLYECEKDLLQKAYSIQEDKPFPDTPLPKSVSSVSLSSMDWMHGAAVKPAFLDFSGINFNSVYGMRRSFSEGDIKTLENGNGNMNIVQSPRERPFLISNCTGEERQEKLSRYRNKKSKRNFGRKIKYACRKALADSQPRIRGRFAKSEESDAKRQ